MRVTGKVFGIEWGMLLHGAMDGVIIFSQSLQDINDNDNMSSLAVYPPFCRREESVLSVSLMRSFKCNDPAEAVLVLILTR